MLLPLRSWDPDKISYNRWNTDGASDVIYSSKQKLEKRQNISLEKTVLVTCKISDLYPLVPIQNNSLVHLVSSKRKYNMYIYIYILYILYILYIYLHIFCPLKKKLLTKCFSLLSNRWLRQQPIFYWLHFNYLYKTWLCRWPSKVKPPFALWWFLPLWQLLRDWCVMASERLKALETGVPAFWVEEKRNVPRKTGWKYDLKEWMSDSECSGDREHVAILSIAPASNRQVISLF